MSIEYSTTVTWDPDFDRRTVLGDLPDRGRGDVELKLRGNGYSIGEKAGWGIKTHLTSYLTDADLSEALVLVPKELRPRLVRWHLDLMDELREGVLRTVEFSRPSLSNAAPKRAEVDDAADRLRDLHRLRREAFAACSAELVGYDAAAEISGRLDG